MTEKICHGEEQKRVFSPAAISTDCENQTHCIPAQPKISLQEAIIVEGRYDKIRLSEFVASPIIETGGFRVFKDKEKQQLIRMIAERRGLLIMTDVDSAGFVIRNFLRGIIPEEKLMHAYIPTVKGKERRKTESSKEGILGVEGLDREALVDAIRKSGAHIDKSLSLVKGSPAGAGEELNDCTSVSVKPTSSQITKADFYAYGLTGTDKAAERREKVLASLGLPRYLTTNAMIAALNCLFTKKEFETYIRSL